VEADRPGDYTLTSPNFSYRDEYGRPVRVSDWSALVPAEAARPEPVRVARTAPRLRVEHVEHEDGRLEANKWGRLEVLVRNQSDVPVADVLVMISGPIETDGKNFRIAELRDGRVARIQVSVCPDRGGLVPVSVRLTFSYPDGLGSLARASQDEQVDVGVARPEDVAAKRTRTILFLAACPKDLARIRLDLELRRIRQELQLGKRDDFLLVDDIAVRLTDISRSLVRHKPDIVHFSGHGDEQGRIYVEDSEGFSKPTNIEGMAELFGRHRATIRCVVVNACNSERLAKAISKHIDHAIGMSDAVPDHVAIAFSVDFYQTFFDGADVPDAFEHARALLHADEETTEAYQVPMLYPPGLR